MAVKHRFKKVVIPLQGIHCSSCVLNIENSLKTMGGIESVFIHLSTKTAIIKFDEDSIRLEKILNKISELGYTPVSVMENYIESQKVSNLCVKEEERNYFKKFILSAIFSVLLFYDYIFNFSPYFLFVVTCFIWLYCGWHFHKGFYYSLKRKSANMNTLVSLSSSIAFIYTSLMSFNIIKGNLFHNHIHWHEISMLIAFINLGKYLEAKSKGRLGDVMSSLFRMLPKFSILIDKDGKQILVNSKDIKKGDRILVKAGQQSPVDGFVVSGNGFFDEAMITGEQMPVQKSSGSFIYAGSINKGNPVEIIAENVASDMLIAKIAQAIGDNQSIKMNIQKKVDKISSIFVPIILCIAFFSGTFWLIKENLSVAITVFASVLVSACPCAMGLSVPIAISAGFIRGSKLGFLINNPEVLENFEKINTIIFDKTGTLTYGNLRVSEIKPYKISEEKFLKFLLTAEINSEHLLSDAVKNYCFLKNIKPYKAIETISVIGKGVKTKISDFEIIAGNIALLEENNVKVPVPIWKELEQLENPYILLAINGKYAGYVIFKDCLREDMKVVIDNFKKRGIVPVIASGDKMKVVAEVAKKLGIEEFYSEIKPEEKYSVVLRYKALGKKVMMIGDGVNDAMAVKEADIGIAMKSASDITSSSSDIILMRDDLSLILKLLDLAIIMKKIINQNLFWAFLYNIILIPVASGIFYKFNGFLVQPYMAALAMGLSSVSVVTNSLRLLKVKI